MSIEKQRIGEFELECCGNIRRLIAGGVGDIEFDICRLVLSFNPKDCCDVSFNLQKDSHLYTKKIFYLEMSKEPLKEQVNSIALFQNFLKYSYEIISENSCFMSKEDKESRIFFCRVFIELLEENNLSISQAYGYTYLKLLELNLELAEKKYNSEEKKLADDLYYALSKWLNVCQNPQYTVFESEQIQIDRENETNKAIFKDGELKPDLKGYRFQELIRNIAVNWYLKARYNIWTAKRLLCAVNSKSQLFNCFLPRMFSAIIVGYLALVMQGDAWKLAYRMYTYHPLLLLFVAMPLIFIASFAYLYIEIAKISANWKDRLKRTLLIWIIGLLESSVIGLVICKFISEYFSSIILGLEDVFIEPVHCLGYPQAFFLFFPLAMFIGIFVQIIWEEKPITHPL